MANIVDMKTVLKFLGLDALTTEDKNLELIRDSVESWISTYCRRNLVSTNYKEKYDGTGCNSLVLDNYPIISLKKPLMKDLNDTLLTHKISSQIFKALQYMPLKLIPNIETVFCQFEKCHPHLRDN